MFILPRSLFATGIAAQQHQRAIQIHAQRHSVLSQMQAMNEAARQQRTQWTVGFPAEVKTEPKPRSISCHGCGAPHPRAGGRCDYCGR